MRVSLEEDPKIKAETSKRIIETEESSPGKLLLENQAIKAKVASMIQDVNHNHAQSPRGESIISTRGKGRLQREHRRGCNECNKKGVGNYCTHCWKCGDSTHFTYNFPPKEKISAGKFLLAAVKGQPVAEENDVDSHHSTGCKKQYKIIFYLC